MILADCGFDYESSQRFHSIHSAYWWLRCLFWKTQDTNRHNKNLQENFGKTYFKKTFFLRSYR